MCTPPSMKFTFCMRRVSWSVCNSTLRASCWGPIRPGCISPRWEHLPPQSLWASAALKGAPYHENSDFFVIISNCLCVALIVFLKVTFSSGIYVCVFYAYVCQSYIHTCMLRSEQDVDFFLYLFIALRMAFPELMLSEWGWMASGLSESACLCPNDWVIDACSQTRLYLNAGHLNRGLMLAQQMFLPWSRSPSPFLHCECLLHFWMELLLCFNFYSYF